MPFFVESRRFVVLDTLLAAKKTSVTGTDSERRGNEKWHTPTKREESRSSSSSSFCCCFCFVPVPQFHIRQLLGHTENGISHEWQRAEQKFSPRPLYLLLLLSFIQSIFFSSFFVVVDGACVFTPKPNKHNGWNNRKA